MSFVSHRRPSLSRSRFVAIVASAGLLLVTGSPGVVARNLTPTTVTPTGVASSTWGWVVARHPSTANYTPALKDRGNSSGGVNKVTRNSLGLYTVKMPGIGFGGGIAHVTPLGNTPHICVIEEWGGSPAEFVTVACLTRSGDPADSQFVVNYLVAAGPSGGSSARLGYLWADQESAGTYTPNPTYSYNSSGNTNSISRADTGSYWVDLLGLGADNHGDVQVTAYGATAVCRIIEWGHGAGALNVHVLCRDIAGAPVDARFTLTWMKNLALKGYNGTRSYYLWANHKSTTNYHPAPSRTFSTVGAAPPSIHRSATGTYTATLPGMHAGGGVQVTSYGADKGHCIVASIATTGSTQKVGVRCFNVAGHLQDTQFTLAYAR